MADNVNITAGTGTAIAADDVSSVFYQKVKLLIIGKDGDDYIINDPIDGARVSFKERYRDPALKILRIVAYRRQA